MLDRSDGETTFWSPNQGTFAYFFPYRAFDTVYNFPYFTDIMRVEAIEFFDKAMMQIYAKMIENPSKDKLWMQYPHMAPMSMLWINPWFKPILQRDINNALNAYYQWRGMYLCHTQTQTFT